MRYLGGRSVFQIEWPIAFLLLPLPLLVFYGLPARVAQQHVALRVPSLTDFEMVESTRREIQPRRWQQWLLVLAWLLLVFASSRPQWLGETITMPVSGRDLVIAMDLSDSMRTADFKLDGKKVNRLQAAKQVASQFIDRRRGDRVGLILFGSQAYLQTPLTFDLKTTNQLLQESAIGLAGERTAIGDAIGLAIKRLADDPAESRVMILMTDGANTAGEVSPIRAAKLAADRGLKIYTIGIGADAEIETTWFGLRKTRPVAQLDEDTLTQIAELTDGRYYRARDSAELAKIYTLIDQLEPVDSDNQSLRPVSALFIWPLGLSLISILLLLLPPIWRRSQ